MHRGIVSYLVGVALLLAPAFAGAATVTARSQDVGASDPNVHDCFNQSSGPTATCTSGPQTSTGGGTGFGTASTNMIAGELRARATAANNGPSGNVAALGFATLAETYAVSGSGEVTVFYHVQGSWNLTEAGPPGSAGFQVYADILPAAGGPVDFFVTSGGALSGSVDQIFSETFQVLDGSSFTIQFDLLAQITGNADGEINLADTAWGFVVAGTGVVLTPTDPLFLSDPTFGQAVPLPGTVVLLAAGLVGLVLHKVKKRRTR